RCARALEDAVGVFHQARVAALAARRGAADGTRVERIIIFVDLQFLVIGAAKFLILRILHFASAVFPVQPLYFALAHGIQTLENFVAAGLVAFRPILQTEVLHHLVHDAALFGR